MGLSFPQRFSRGQLGPKLRNNYPVENPESDIGDTTFNAAFAAIAGMNLVASRVAVVAKWNSTSLQFDVSHQAEAWNPDNAQAHPVLARSSTGRYTLTFASTYLDEDGQSVNPVLVAAKARALRALSAWSDRVDIHCFVDTVNPLIINIWFGDSAGNPIDAAFWLEVL